MEMGTKMDVPFFGATLQNIYPTNCWTLTVFVFNELVFQDCTISQFIVKEGRTGRLSIQNKNIFNGAADLSTVVD